MRKCITKEYPKNWRVRRSYTPILSDIFETSLAAAKKTKEGIEIEDPEDSSVVSEMMHLTYLTINPEDQDTEDLSYLMEEKHQEKHPDSSLVPQLSLSTETTGAEITSSNKSNTKPNSVIEENKEVIPETSS